MKCLTLLITALSMLLCSCAAKPAIEYRYINIPVKCSVIPPTRPAKVMPVALWLTDVITYTLELEAALNICVGGPNEKTNK